MKTTHHHIRVWLGNSLRSWRLPSGATIGDIALLLGDYSSDQYRRPIAVSIENAPTTLLH